MAGQRQLDQIKRFDMPGFTPPIPYIREMKRYGVLPKDQDAAVPFDCAAADRAYWHSFDAQRALEHPAYTAEGGTAVQP